MCCLIRNGSLLAYIRGGVTVDEHKYWFKIDWLSGIWVFFFSCQIVRWLSVGSYDRAWVQCLYCPLLLFCLIWFFTSQSTILQSCWDGSSTMKQRIKCRAEGQNAVPQVRLKPATPRSWVKHSTSEPLRSSTVSFALSGIKIPQFQSKRLDITEKKHWGSSTHTFSC